MKFCVFQEICSGNPLAGRAAGLRAAHHRRALRAAVPRGARARGADDRELCPARGGRSAGSSARVRAEKTCTSSKIPSRRACSPRSRASAEKQPATGLACTWRSETPSILTVTRCTRGRGGGPRGDRLLVAAPVAAAAASGAWSVCFQALHKQYVHLMNGVRKYQAMTSFRVDFLNSLKRNKR